MVTSQLPLSEIGGGGGYGRARLGEDWRPVGRPLPSGAYLYCAPIRENGLQRRVVMADGEKSLLVLCLGNGDVVYLGCEGLTGGRNTGQKRVYGLGFALWHLE